MPLRYWNCSIYQSTALLTNILFISTGIQREEEKAKRTLKDAAKKNDKDSCVVLAKEIVNARRTINKIHVSKTQLNSIQMQMKNQLCTSFSSSITGFRTSILIIVLELTATLRVAGSLQKSTEVMQMMQNLIKVPEVAATMREMSKEMMKVCNWFYSIQM